MLTPIMKSSAVLEIERLGFEWHEEAQYDLDQLDKARRVQVREFEHYAPKASVAQYAVQMGQTVFPPIVVTRNGWIVDGNTREEARRMRKEKYSPAIVINVDFGKNTKTDARLHALAATLNQTGGQRLTPAEARIAVKRILAGGESWRPEQVSRAVGVKASTISQVKREMAAEAKFAKVGFTDFGKMSTSIIRALGGADVVALNDVPYKQLCELTVDANLGPKEISELAKEMKGTGSDTGMLGFVDTKRTEMSVRIKEHALLGNGKPPPSSLLRRVLGHVTKYESTPSALVERAPDAMAEHLKVLTSSITTLQAVLELQQEVNDA